MGTRHIEAAAALKALKVDVLPCGLGDRVAFIDMLVEGLTPSEYNSKGAAATEARTLYEAVMKLAAKAKRAKKARAA